MGEASPKEKQEFKVFLSPPLAYSLACSPECRAINSPDNPGDSRFLLYLPVLVSKLENKNLPDKC